MSKSKRHSVLKCKSVFITGCNRPNSIGFHLVKQILERIKPEHCFATCRKPSEAKELNDLASKYGNLHVVELDVLNHEKFGDVVAYVDEVTGGQGLNLLINNSGICNEQSAQKSIYTLDKKLLQEHFDVNTFAPIFLTKAFLPLLEKAVEKSLDYFYRGIGKAAIVNVSTIMASIGELERISGGGISYRTSKVALNMLTQCMSLELKSKGIVTVLLHPGWVKTDMGGPDALIDCEESVSGMITVLENIDETDNGKFLQFQGKEIPW